MLFKIISRFLLPAAILLILLTPVLQAQQDDTDRINNAISQQDIEFDIYFLASDELLGRDTGTQELKIASRYIATHFQTNGVQKPEGYDFYYQDVPLRRITPPEQINLTIGESSYHKDTDLIAMNTVRDSLNAPVVLLEYATQEELEEQDVEGAIVFSGVGLPGQSSPQQFFMSSSQKMEWVKDAGGIALVELYSNMQFPWQMLVNFLGGEQIVLDEGEEGEIPVLWMNATDETVSEKMEEIGGRQAGLNITGEQPERFLSRNVIGIIEGSDPELKNEYVLLGAHYDHTGVVPDQTEGNFIFNGARDNAVGMAGILSAATYLSENRPRRSVIFAAWTAEEVGLLGSGYYADNPAVPLEETIYQLNIDGAGYNDTTKVTVIGLGRTEADDELKNAASSFGLEAIADPAPEQNLFDRSDNVHFARNGIPAPTYSMGLTGFDEEIQKFYHQVTDEPDTINYEYVTRYIRSFVKAAQDIANRNEAPFWLPGDVYEEAGKELYRRD